LGPGGRRFESCRPDFFQNEPFRDRIEGLALIAVRIGLLRHFPVDQKFPTGWRTAADLQAWRDRYDLAETFVGEFDLGGVDWQACISSDLPRTCITANAVFLGEVKHTALLREPQFTTFKTGNLRLPFWVWRWLLRFSWMMGHRSQRDCRDEFHRRVMALADQLSALEQDTLVVSHAGMMAYLSAELRHRGFVGPKLRIAKHATAYIYHKNSG
jgi:broad specificity phosphatase PhoE